MKATIAVNTTPSSFPIGTVGGGWVFYVVDAKGNTNQKQVVDNPSATFDVDPETHYIARAQRLDINQTPLGAMVEERFNTVSDTVTIETASSINITVTE